MNKLLAFKRWSLAALCAMLLVIPFYGYYVDWAELALQKSKKETVVMTAVDPSGTAKGTALHVEVRRGGVKMDPQRFLEESSAQGEWYAEDGRLHVDSLETPLFLQLSYPNTYEFYFDSFLDSPSVKIECEHDSSVHNLYHENYYYHQYKVVQGNEKHQALGVSLSQRLSESIALIAFLLLTVLICRFKVNFAWIGYWFTWIGMVVTAVLLKQQQTGYVLLLLLSAVAMATLQKNASCKQTAAALSRGWTLAGMIFLCLYTSFAVYGNRLFLELPTIRLTARTISMFWMLTAITAPMLYLLVSALILGHQKVLEKQRVTLDPPQRRVAYIRLLCAVLMLVPFCVVLIGFYPCVTSSDGTGYWNRALGISAIGQPFGYTMVVKAMASISPNPLIYAVVQISLFIFALSGILALLYKRGLPGWMAMAIALLTALIPSNYMNVILLSTNAFIAVLLVYALYLLAQLADDPLTCTRRASWFVQTAMVGLVLGYTRRNAMPSLLALLAVIAYFAWKYRRQIGKKLAALLVVTVLLSGLVSGIEKDMLEEANAENSNTGSIARFLFKPVMAAYVNGAALPEETMATVEKVMDEQWLEMYYDPHNSDPLTMSPRYMPHSVSTSEYLHMFLDTFMRYPAAVAKDLIDQSELAWCVFECPTNWNLRYRADVDSFLLPEESWVPSSPCPQITQAVRHAALGVAEAAASVPVLDSLFYRAGIYVILLIIQVGALLAKRRWSMLLLALPALALEATTFVAASFPFLEYHWFWILSVPLFMLICMFVDETPKSPSSL